MLAGIDAALDAGLDPVKVNAVVMRGVNDDEVVDLAAFGRERGVGVRFIEFMPLDADGGVEPRPGRARATRSSSASTPCSRSSRSPSARTSSRPSGSATATAAATSASSRASPSRSASSCDRVRLTAEGQFRTCLFALDETDLRAAAARRRATDDDLAAARSRARSAPSGPATASARSTSSAPTGR